jgi:hypothetical protein
MDENCFQEERTGEVFKKQKQKNIKPAVKISTESCSYFPK